MERGLQSVICSVGSVGKAGETAVAEERRKAVKHCLKIWALDGKLAQVLHLRLQGEGRVEQYTIIANCGGNVVEQTYSPTEFYRL